MWGLLLTLCLSANACYTTAPMKFENMQDCFSAAEKLQRTKQVKANAVICNFIHRK